MLGLSIGGLYLSIVVSCLSESHGVVLEYTKPPESSLCDLVGNVMCMSLSLSLSSVLNNHGVRCGRAWCGILGLNEAHITQHVYPL